MTNMRSGLYINTEGFRDRLSSYSFTWCAGLLRHGGWGVRSQLALSHLNWSNTTNYSHSGQLVSQVSTGPRYLHRLLTTRQADKPATFLEGQQTAFTSSPCYKPNLSMGQIEKQKVIQGKMRIILGLYKWFVSQFRFQFPCESEIGSNV